MNPGQTRSNTRLQQLLLALAVMAAGAATAYLSYRMMQFSLRYAIAAAVGLTGLTLAMVFIRRLPDILLYAIVLSIPVLTFEKTFFLRDTWVDFGTPGVNIGLLDILLFGGYSLWFIEVIVMRQRPLPRLHWLDGFVLAYFLANAASLLTTASITYTMFEMFRLTKYVMVYFFIAKRLERRHIRGIVYCLLFALLMESALGVVQHRMHKLVGIARSKGAATAEMSTQYEVPQFEGHRRAEGTTIDSHAMGIYMAILLLYPFCIALSPWFPGRERLFQAACFLAGVPGLIATFSRGAWGAFAIAVVFVLIVFFLWKERRALGVFIIICLLGSPAALIGGAKLIGKRIFRAPSEIMDARWDTLVTGWDIWLRAPLTGGGANAYFHAQRDLGTIHQLTNDKPAHNVLIYIVAQTGLLGLLTYIALGIAILVATLKLMRWKDPVLSPLALAIIAGFLAIQADGAIDFMSFTNQVYCMKFFEAGLITAMLGMLSTRPNPEFVRIQRW